MPAAQQQQQCRLKAMPNIAISLTWFGCFQLLLCCSSQAHTRAVPESMGMKQYCTHGHPRRHPMPTPPAAAGPFNSNTPLNRRQPRRHVVPISSRDATRVSLFSGFALRSCAEARSASQRVS